MPCILEVLCKQKFPVQNGNAPHAIQSENVDKKVLMQLIRDGKQHQEKQLRSQPYQA